MTTTEPTTRVGTDALLEQTAWLRSLARRLVVDPDRAEDLAQATILRAIEQPPDGRGSLRAWLRSVASRIARQEARTDGRRRRREQSVLREASAPAAHTLAAEAESQRALITAVLDLDEPYRSTVLLRYFREMPCREIARTLGVPGSTVRNRLHRAHEKLRAELDRRHGGDRRAWCLGFLPLLAGSGVDGAPAAPMLAALKLATGVVTMSVKIKGILLGTALVATLAGVAWFGSRSPAPADPIEEPPTASRDAADPDDKKATGVASTPVPALVHEAAPRAHASPQAMTPAIWTGRVVDVEGNPIENARVISLPGGTRKIPVDASPATTDRDGRFTLEDSSGVGSRVRAEADGYFHAIAGSAAGAPIEVVLPRAARLRGRVTDATTGAPIDKVTLHWWHMEPGVFDCCIPRVLTASDGSYEFEKVPEGVSLSLAVRALPAYPRRDRTFVVEPGDNVLDIVLEAGIPLVIEVVDFNSGEPIADATVIDGGRGYEFGRTNADGRVEIAAVPETIVDPQVDFCVLADGYCGVRRMIPEPEDLEPGQTIRFLLPRGATVEGFVRTSDGAPVANASLSSRFAGNVWGYALHETFPERFADFPENDRLTHYTKSLTATTDDSGNFRIDGFLVGGAAIDITAHHPEHARGSVRITDERMPGDVLSCEIVLAASGSVEGRVVIDGQPAKTRLRWTGSTQSGYGFSDESGAFLLERVEAGEVRVGAYPTQMVSRGDPPIARTVSVQSGKTTRCNLEVELTHTWIAGRAIDRHGRGVEGLKVLASGPHVRSHATTDEDGAYRIEMPDLGDPELFVTVFFGEQGQSVSREGVAPGSDGVDFLIPDVGTWPVRVVCDDTGASIPRYDLKATSTDGDTTTARVGSSEHPMEADGTFRLELPEGRYEITVTHVDASFRTETLRDVLVLADREPETTEVRLRQSSLTIDWKGDLSRIGPGRRALMLLPEAYADDVHVEFSDRPVTGIAWNSSMTIYRDRSPDRRHFVVIDSSGRQRLHGLAPGRYRFRSWPDDLVLDPDVIDIPDEPRTSVSVRFDVRDR